MMALEKLINHVQKGKFILLLNFLKISANLKNVPRQGWIDKLEIKNPESVADHTFSMAIIGMILSDSKKYNTEKILKMILLHDLAESITGDITPEQKNLKDKKRMENKTMKEILSHLPEKNKIQYLEIWNEYQDNNTIDSNLVHQIDKFEMALQAKIYEKQTKSKKTNVFFESAKKQISEKNLRDMLEKLCEMN